MKLLLIALYIGLFSRVPSPDGTYTVGILQLIALYIGLFSLAFLLGALAKTVTLIALYIGLFSRRT